MFNPSCAYISPGFSQNLNKLLIGYTQSRDNKNKSWLKKILVFVMWPFYLRYGDRFFCGNPGESSP